MLRLHPIFNANLLELHQSPSGFLGRSAASLLSNPVINNCLVSPIGIGEIIDVRRVTTVWLS